jgi:two-component system response regulator NreC
MVDKIRLLVADDHGVLRAGLRSLVNAEPDMAVVGEAVDGEEAVRRAQELRPDVILMDIGMPGANGLEATRRIQQLGLPSRVLILTVHPEEEYLVRVLRAGAYGYVKKESADTDLLEAIRTVSRGGAFLYPHAMRTLLTEFVHRASPEERQAYQRLSERERQVLLMTAEGLTNQEIGERLSISPKTVDTYRSRLMNKLGLWRRSELVDLVLRLGLLPEAE